jgi:diguanylate cyclase (GGDEF)-like protein
MTSRVRAVGALAFRPAARVVGRLRYAQKFVMVGLILLVPLGLVAGAYVDLQREQIAFSAKEEVGVRYMEPLIGLTAQVVEARHRAVSVADDGEPDLAAALAAVDAADRTHRDVLRSTGRWVLARRLILAAERNTGSPAARYEAYNAATEALLALVVHVGDESNLTLDPDLDTYYLMDTLQFRLPVLLDVAGRIEDQVALGGDPDDVRIGLALNAGVLSNTRKIVTRAVETVSTTTASERVRRVTTEHFERLDRQLVTLEEALTSEVKNHAYDAVPADAADGAREAAAAFAAVSAGALKELLHVRIAGFSSRAQRVVIGTGLAAALAIYLFIGFYLSVAAPIRRIVATLHGVAHGDLTRRVEVDTHDELSFVATALNETVAKTEIATERLAEQATYDALTALPNRAVVVKCLERALAGVQRSGGLMASLFIDLDRFKLINDSLGHEAGDEVLCAVADRLRATVRPGDTVGRLAGDEFVVISEKLAIADNAVRLAERIVEALTAPITIGASGFERQVCVGASVGISFADGSIPLTAEDMLRDADMAMYRAKQRGRGRVEIFDDALRVEVERRLESQADLRRGIAQGELRVHYQPIVDLATGVVAGFEALVRWQHPTRGLLGAGEFIDVAEETGLVVRLGSEILALACREIALWRETKPDLYVSINVSGVQLRHPSFVGTVRAVLADTGLEPDALWLEITETSIMTDAEAVRATLETLRDLGVHLAIDDFGTGYSSLAYLRRFPVDALKIDGSFVAGLGRDREDDAIVSMIIGLARTLDLVAIAEGVETSAQLEHLWRLGCTAAQGYHLGRPGSADKVWETVSGAWPVRTVPTVSSAA